MATRELSSSVKMVHSLDVTNITSDTNTDGAAVDTDGFNSITICVASGLGGGYTDGTFTADILECDTSGGSYTAVTEAGHRVEQSGTVSLAADNTVAWIGYVGIKQFVKVRAVSTSTSSGANICGWVLLGHPHNAPVTAN